MYAKGVGQIISVLAILLMGGTYVPIDVLQPEERINRIAKNAQLSLLIVSDSDPSYSIYATFCNRIVWQKFNPPRINHYCNIDISLIKQLMLFILGSRAYLNYLCQRNEYLP